MSNCRLDYIELKDFGTFEHLRADLSKSITNIIGLNACGKSTILNAIKLSLQLNDKKIAVNNFIRKDPNPEVEIKKAIVTLGIVIDGQPVTIYSEFSGGNGRKIHRRVTLPDGTKMENTQANNFLTATLGKTNLRLMFALNPKDNFIKSLESDNLKNIMEILSLDFSTEVGKVKDNVKVKERELDASRGNLNTHNSALTTAENILKNNQTEYDYTKGRLTSLKDSNPDLLQKIEETSTEEKDLYHKQAVAFDELSKVEESNKTYQANIEALKSAKATLDAYKKELDQLSTIDLIKKDSQALKDTLENLNAEISKIKEAQASKNQEAYNLGFSITDLNNRIKLISKGVCPTCHQATESVNVQYAEELNKLEETKNQVTSVLTELSTNLDNLTKQSYDASSEIKHNEQVNANIDKTLMRIEHLKGLIKPLEENIALREKQTLAYSDAESLKAKYNEALGNYTAIKSKLTALDSTKNEISKLEAQVENKESDITKLDNQYTEMKARVPDLLNDIKEKEDHLREDQRLAYLFEMIPIVYLQKTKNDIMALATSFVKPFGYDGVYIELDVENKRLSYELVKRGLHITYDLLSGFETDLINLAVVGSLSLLLKVPCICIDELDAHADYSKSKMLADLIRHITKSTQVIAITHKDDVISEWAKKSGSLTIIKLSGGSVENYRE